MAGSAALGSDPKSAGSSPPQSTSLRAESQLPLGAEARQSFRQSILSRFFRWAWIVSLLVPCPHLRKLSLCSSSCSEVMPRYTSAFSSTSPDANTTQGPSAVFRSVWRPCACFPERVKAT
jgi:hypothetical protein